MIPNKKYQKSVITHFSKRKIIIRKGGYYPRRMYLAAILTALLVGLLVMAFTFKAVLGTLFLLPTILGFAEIQKFYRKHIHFGETIIIQRNKILLKLSGSNTKQIEFKKDAIKSMICVNSGDYFQFKLYRNDNSSMSFSVRDVNQQKPLKAILKFANLKLHLENVQGQEKVMRFWSKKRNFKKTARKIENVSDDFFEYRSPYFKIESKDDVLKINIKNHLYQDLEIEKEQRTISYFDNFDEKQSIKFEEIATIKKIVTETAPLNKNNQITIRIQAKLSDGSTSDLLVFKTNEPSPEEMEIVEIDKDFKNLTSIIDMSMKSVIDEDLEILHLEELKKEHQIKLKSPLEDYNP